MTDPNTAPNCSDCIWAQIAPMIFQDQQARVPFEVYNASMAVRQEDLDRDLLDDRDMWAVYVENYSEFVRKVLTGECKGPEGVEKVCTNPHQWRLEHDY